MPSANVFPRNLNLGKMPTVEKLASEKIIHLDLDQKVAKKPL